jgi:hypothetical protein
MVAAYLLDDKDYALTDEQVGTLLGYADPDKAVRKILERNQEELAGLSGNVK